MRLFWYGTAWLAGIAFGRLIAFEVPVWLFLSGCTFCAAVFFRRRRPIRLFALLLFLISVGAARYRVALPVFGDGHIASYNDTSQPLTFEGVLVAAPDVRDTYAGLTLRVDRFHLEGEATARTADGLVLIRAPREVAWAYGDRLRVTGTLETPPEFEGFSYRDYLARRGVYSVTSDASIERIAVRQGNPILQVVNDLRVRALKAVYAMFPDPEASLMAGILLGVESGISPEVRQAFNDTGTTHVIAISGFNITLVSSVVISLFRSRLGARRGALAAGAAIAVYTLLVGADAAVVRAALMGGLALMARSLGRQTYALASLAGAAMAMTAVNPLVLWDVSFQLSFTATLGLVLYAQPLKQWFVGVACRWMPEERAARIAGPVSEYGLFTLAAQVTTIPLTAYTFQRFSLVTFLANPTILPAQPGLMVLGGLATLLGAIWTPLGQPLAWLAWPFPAFTIRAVTAFAAVTGASIAVGKIGTPVMVGYYALLFGATAWARLPVERRPRAPALALKVPVALALVGLAVSVGLVWRGHADQPDGRLHVTALDVGEAEAVLIETPEGRFVLVGGGASPILLSEALGRRLPLFGREIDWLVVASTREEQLAGLLGVVDRYPIRSALVSGPPGRGAYQRLIDELTEAGRPTLVAETGQALDLGGGARLEVEAIGERGAVLLLTYGHARILFAPGADPRLVGELVGEGAPGPVTAALLPDGGYAAVNPPEWLATLQPMVALISVEAGNRRGLPSRETLRALEGTTVLRTDVNGWIELATDGERLWVEVERVGEPLGAVVR